MVALAAVATVALAVPGHAGDGTALFGAKYFSTFVTENGEPRKLVGDKPLQVRFVHNETNDAVRWSSGCNFYGARVEVTDKRIITGRVLGTAIGCSPAAKEQDEFFVELFRDDPAYVAQGKRLELSTNRTTVKLRRR